MSGDPLRRWKAAGIAATAVIVLSLPVYAVREGRQRARWEGADLTPAFTFVGRERCSECHEEATEAWRGSDHDNAMAPADSTSVRGDFADAEFEHGGITSRFFMRDGRYFVNTEGPGGVMSDFEIAYTFGWEPLQQYLIAFPGGRYQALSIAWNTERGEWFSLYPDRVIPPDDWLHWTRSAQTWNGMCAECHSTNLRKGYDPETDSFETTWSEIDVSCEACHGPGSRHVAWADLPPMARPQVEDYDLAVPTSGITSRRQVELCAPCHSRRTELGDYDHLGGDLLDHLVPAVLEEGLYQPDGQILDEVYVWGSFVQSKMYRNNVRCSNCHDPHSLQLVKDGNDLCLQCHRAETYDTYEHHFHEELTEAGEPNEGTLCVKCHMPEKPYMVVDWRADHSLRIPRPDLSLQIGTTNACTAGGCHDDETDQWAADYYVEWYGKAKRFHYGITLAAGRRGDPEAGPQLIRLAEDSLYPAIARATALSLLQGYPGPEATRAFNAALQDEESLIRYTAAMSVGSPDPAELVDLIAPLLFDPARAIRGQAAVRLAAVPRNLLKPYQATALDEATAEYEETMAYSLDFPFAGHNLGNLYLAQGDTARAESYYRRAIGIDDLFVPAKMNLVVLLNAQGRNDEAETLLRQVLDAYPDNHDAEYALALLLVETGRSEEALEWLTRAAEGMPARTRVRYNLGLLQQQLGRVGEAESSLRATLAAEPGNLDYLYALADFYARRGEYRRALELADRMIATHPEAAIGSQMKAAIEQAIAAEGN
ncbi:MAG: tetratricopeptide repeat protein [Candidatus Palauibacterales bacterium]|nr:tetratricopeptide repeat protein [Candidatus Palauibacterales bacterium]MDP2483516.1 tetratricopeptide repeat protein [Candidatus Palauibacterales bacterium]